MRKIEFDCVLNEDLLEGVNLTGEVSQFSLPKDKVFFKNFNLRHKFFYESDAKLDYNFFRIFSIKDKMVITKKFGVTDPQARLENGVFYLDIPTSEIRDPEHKKELKIVLNPNHLIFSYYVNLEDVEHGSEEFEKIISLPNRITYNVVSKKTDVLEKFLNYDHNDMLLNGKKFWGEERAINKFGVFSIGNTVMNVTEYSDFHDPIFENDEGEGRLSGKGMTGIEEEIPGYTKEEFLEDYLIETHKLIKEIEDM